MQSPYGPTTASRARSRNAEQQQPPHPRILAHSVTRTMTGPDLTAPYPSCGTGGWRAPRPVAPLEVNMRHSDSLCFSPSATIALHHIAFYQFTRAQDVDTLVAQLRALTVRLKGSILVAPEGINGMLAGEATTLDEFESALVAMPGYANTVFKRTLCRVVPFNKMKIRRKAEIVPLGISGVNVADGTGINVSPAEWRQLIDQDDVVVLDNRNSFEYRLGRFRNAIDPGVAHFRDFPEYVKAHLEEWKSTGKRVAMYCTGGIRCEKTTAWMRDFDLPVYQLEGGILNYFLTMHDAHRDWDGECFVFDNRISLDTNLQETNTTLEDVYQGEPDGEWRLSRARRLQADSD
jgi:UPF0176 protein